MQLASSRVDNMLDYFRESNFSLMRETFRENHSKAIRHAAHDRLASPPRGPYKKLRVLHEWIDGVGRPSSIFDVSLWFSSCLHFVSLLMLGELPVHRVRAYYALISPGRYADCCARTSARGVLYPCAAFCISAWGVLIMQGISCQGCLCTCA